MTSTIAILLQLAATLLTGAQNNPQVSLAAKQQVVAVAGQTIQLSTQAIAEVQGQINFPVPQNSGIWPNIRELMAAPYIDARGGYTQLGVAVHLDSATISFGDLNGDGYDDAMVIIKRLKADGSTESDLAAMLNQGGIMFNIADTPLGNNIQLSTIASHQIQNGEFVMNENVRYSLLGNQLIKE
jgi:hypothetical protein